MKTTIMSWNVNGIRAAAKSGIADEIAKLNPGYICLQEIKSDERTVPIEISSLGYHIFLNPALRKGYSGTMILARTRPDSIITGIGIDEFDTEGRVMAIETNSFWLVNAYFPNSQRDLKRLDYKLRFDREFSNFCKKIGMEKSIIICGDLNVAHEDIDIARPDDNRNNAGFTSQEREWMSQFLDSGFIDTFRLFNKESGHYSWWSYRFNARERNIGWRLDYFLVSNAMSKNVISSEILQGIMGSDHAPVRLTIEI